MLVYGQDEEVERWVCDRIPHMDGVYGPHSAIGVLSKEGKLIAGVIYHDYQAEFDTVQLSMAASNPMWARKENIAGLLAYPFRQLGVFKCWIACPITGEYQIGLWNHIGFEQEAILEHQFGKGVHAVIMKMFRPFFERNYGDYVNG